MTALFDPTMRAVTRACYQSERPSVVDSSKFEWAFGSGAKPLQQTVPATVAWFEITSGLDGIDIQLRAHGHPGGLEIANLPMGVR